MKVYKYLIDAILTQGIIPKDYKKICRLITEKHYKYLFKSICEHAEKWGKLPEISDVENMPNVDYEYEEKIGNIFEYIDIVKKDSFYRDFISNLQEGAESSKSFYQHTSDYKYEELMELFSDYENNYKLLQKKIDLILSISTDVLDYKSENNSSNEIETEEEFLRRCGIDYDLQDNEGEEL